MRGGRLFLLNRRTRVGEEVVTAYTLINGETEAVGAIERKSRKHEVLVI